MSQDQTTPATRWKWHDETFASLMLGRVQLAQISRGSSRHWSWTLFFCDRAAKRRNIGATARELQELGKLASPTLHVDVRTTHGRRVGECRKRLSQKQRLAAISLRESGLPHKI
jgi:hypothetical protein